MDVRATTDRVRGWFEYTADPSEAAAALVALWHANAWTTYGHDSWAAYCAAEFSVKPKWAPEVRRILVAALRAEGMSQRDVGAALGVNQSQVSRDANASPGSVAAERPTLWDWRNGYTAAGLAALDDDLLSRDVDLFVRLGGAHLCARFAVNKIIGATGAQARLLDRSLESLWTAVGYERDPRPWAAETAALILMVTGLTGEELEHLDNGEPFAYPVYAAECWPDRGQWWRASAR